MEIGTEISQKIRSAIKAKLVELGAYVDEELPDYIMVMVANKKSQLQMSEDLRLFLGANTDKFTLWLQNLLNKLQSITTDNSSAKDKERESTKQDSATSSSKKVVLSPQNTEKEAQAPATSVHHVKPFTRSSSQSKEFAASIEEDELEPELLVQADTDEFNEEMKLEEEKNVATKKSVNVISRSGWENKPLESQKNIKITSRVRPTRRHAWSSRTLPLKQSNQVESKVNSEHTQKKHVTASVVGSVIYHGSDEEEYDPYNPSVGNVASVVHVTERKSSVPPALQANKSLLLKAVKEAHKSVAEVAAKNRLSCTIGNAVKTQIEVEEEIAPSKTKIRKLELVSKFKNRLNEHVDRKKAYSDSRLVQCDDLRVPSVLVDCEDTRISVIDSKISIPNTQLPVVDPEIKQMLESENEEFELNLEEDTSDMVNLETLVHSENKRIVKEKNKEKLMQNTEFIVTLDGISPDHFKKLEPEVLPELLRKRKRKIPQIRPFAINLQDTDEDDDCDESSSSSSSSQENSVIEHCKFWPSCAKGTDCPFYHPTVLCKSFPNCNFGGKCLYIHPNCKFDGVCSRPDCPFVHTAKKQPATVSALTLPAPKDFQSCINVSVKKQIKCKFFPKCKNMNCHFIHPKEVLHLSIHCNL